MAPANTMRIPPLPLDEMDPEQRRLANLGADAVVQVLARAPELMRASSALGGFLLAQGTMAPRIRELTILRVALRCQAPYEWANHVPAALGSGATEAEIVALSDPDAVWDSEDAAVLRAVDELCAEDVVSDPTWAALASAWDHAQILELLFLVGYYRMMAGFLNSAGVPVKPGQPQLGVCGHPESAVPAPVATRPRSGKTGVTGTWQLTFTHPAGSKELILDLTTVGGTVRGSIYDTQLEVTVPIVSGTVEGGQVDFTAEVTDPARFDVHVSAIVDGDVLTGSVTIKGGGTFPVSGFRRG
ncbi:alkylhydroperoxidase family enzyme [Amycolatopsis sulphurea]|uniref:Alkylhydroperoxidase family enzyme n=1 Tax=Amycolatopsis sulphurea TaxID=76022 RepID=A0A2A9F8Y8_9PSEU|nr:carboxymuconolactone decarboxylase family protein [Amycolatopsis sulphurea]PFG46895.1 alkylhydroperoxidase family enzyme [Amycolatopsis sulphurea]